jgi:hypothetical protein
VQDLSAGLESNRGRGMGRGRGALADFERGWLVVARTPYVVLWWVWSSSASALLNTGGGRGFVVVIR